MSSSLLEVVGVSKAFGATHALTNISMSFDAGEVHALLGENGAGKSTILRAIKAGKPEVAAPLYSHVVYDIVEDEQQLVRQPDILILEGLNVLQVGTEATEFVSDYFDFSIYLDADESDIEDWFVERFFALRATVFQNPDSFFRHFAALSDHEAESMAREIWRSINGKNLQENIAPTRSRASLVIHKGSDHRMKEVHLRRL